MWMCDEVGGAGICFLAAAFVCAEEQLLRVGPCIYGYVWQLDNTKLF